MPIEYISRGSDTELAYASPKVAHGADEESVLRHERKRAIGKRALHDEEGKLSADGRRRRYQGCSDDDEGRIGSDGFVKEDLRVGGPRLCALPAEVIWDHHLTSRLPAVGNPFIDRIYDILHTYKLHPGSMHFVGKRAEATPEAQPIVTASIGARCNHVDDTNTWLKASKEIYAILCEQGLEEVSVDITDPELIISPRNIYPVLKTDAIFPIWDTVREVILNEIDLAEVKMVGCYRLGRSVEMKDNVPTVLVLVNRGNSRNWKETRELIVAILDRFSLPTVAVEISTDQAQRSPPRYRGGEIDPKILHSPARLGQSLAIPGNSNYGTFGGFIELKDPRGEWKLFGITCFHCVLPEWKDNDDSADQISAWCQGGIKLFDKNAEHLRLHHPSQSDMEAQIDHLEQKIKRITDDERYNRHLELEKSGHSDFDLMSAGERHNFEISKKQIQEYRDYLKGIRRFISDRHCELGFVAAGSGLKRKGSSGTMDWALIQLNKGREGENLVDISCRFSNIRKELNGFHTGENKDLTGQIAYMCGRTSGYSKGVIHGLRDALVHEDMVDGKNKTVITLEHSVVGSVVIDCGEAITRSGNSGPSSRGTTFTQAGDSGALVHNSVRSVVGLHFGGWEVNQISYFTPVDDLFDDIKAVTGVDGVRVYEW